MEVLESQGFDFLFTGEVQGQRPMSQHKGALRLIARESGHPDLLLRPLSARLLPPTRPEQLGWVDRERLLDLSGRGRNVSWPWRLSMVLPNFLPRPEGVS